MGESLFLQPTLSSYFIIMMNKETDFKSTQFAVVCEAFFLGRLNMCFLTQDTGKTKRHDCTKVQLGELSACH